MITPSQPLAPRQSGGLTGKITGQVGGLAKAAGTLVSFVNPVIGGAIAGVGQGVETAGDLSQDRTAVQAQAAGPLASMESHPAIQVARIDDFQKAIQTNPNISPGEVDYYNQKADEAKALQLKRLGRNANYTG